MNLFGGKAKVLQKIERRPAVIIKRHYFAIQDHSGFDAFEGFHDGRETRV
jgi:hypothetical protein